METKLKPTPILAAAADWLTGLVPVPSYAEFIAAYGNVFTDGRLPMTKRDWDKANANLGERRAYIREFGFSIPCADALDALQAHGPICEIGAGTGFWAKLMQLHGIDIVASDSYTGDYGFTPGRHFPVTRMHAALAVSVSHGRTIFCSWPSYNDPWFKAALKQMMKSQTLIVIREECCATAAAWEYLCTRFTQLAETPIPCWFGIHDRFEVWQKL